MDYIFLQNYWWFLVSLLGALLVFLLFVQGGNSLLFTLGRNDEERALLVNSTGRKWEFTFTTLVTFGGCLSSLLSHLFYSTSLRRCLLVVDDYSFLVSYCRLSHTSSNPSWAICWANALTNGFWL